jgi:radical SAM superfamily enzyme YgiQ (UPF0313 family)
VRVLLVDLGSPRQEKNEPIGVETLAAVLGQRLGDMVDVQVACSELDGTSLRDLLAVNQHDLIGLSAKIGTFPVLEEAIKQIREFGGDPAPLVVLGGTLPTYVWTGMLRAFPGTICVIGEGEVALAEIVRRAIGSKRCERDSIREYCRETGVPNTAVIMDDVVHVGERRLTDLKTVPGSARRFAEEIVYHGGLLRIEGSRGCPWSHCAFCAIPTKYGGGGWRPFPIERILKEIEYLGAMEARKLYFTDEDFVGPDAARVVEICEGVVALKRRGRIPKELSFFVSSSIASMHESSQPRRMNSRLLEKMKWAGVEEVFIGVESGSASQLRRYRKDHTVDEARECIAELKRWGFVVDIGFMMFDPELTLQELQDNLAFCRETGIYRDHARLSKSVRLTPLTPLAERLMKMGAATPSINEAAFDYEFCFEEIAAIRRVYLAWEGVYLPMAYDLQTTLRGKKPVSSTDGAEEELRRLRAMDFAFLEDCVRLAERAHGGLERHLQALFAQYAEKVRKAH